MLKDYTLENLKENCAAEDLDFNDLAEKMQNWDVKQWAVFKYENEDLDLVNDISELEIETDEISINGDDLLILTDSEADDREEEELDSYIDDCIIPELPECYQNYFDYDAWKRDAHFDGRGHIIARYDGNETLYSYYTPILIKYKNGVIKRIWTGWSQTTQKHIKYFCGLNKAGFDQLEFLEG